MVGNRLSFERLEARLMLKGDAASKLADAGLAAGDFVPDQYIVTLREGVNVKAFARELSKAGGDVQHVFNDALQGLVYRGEALKPRKDDRIAAIEQDRIVTTLAQTLPTGVDRVQVDQLLPGVVNDGVQVSVDVDIAIIDTGVAPSHPDLNVFAAGSRNFATGSPDWYDRNGHGTHVAGTAAAVDNTVGVVGVAPGARIWALKALGDNGSGYLSDIINAVNYVTANASQIEVANMSLGFQGQSSAFRTAIANSVAAGVVYVVAAGNSGADVYGGDGVFGTSDDFGPASYPEVAAISAMVDTNGRAGGGGSGTSYGQDDSFASFSNRSANVVANNPVTSPGKAIDLLMPGVNILSTWYNGGYATISGTSMASPHAAGLVGLYIAQNGRDRDGDGDHDAADVYAIRQALINGGVTQVSADGLAVQNDPDGMKENIGWAPSVPPASVHDVAVTSIQHSATVIEGDTVTITVTVQNQGTFVETFDVGLNDQTTGASIGTQTVTNLAAGASTTLSYSWIASAPLGNHTLVATATTVAGETDTADNVRNSTVNVQAEVIDVSITAITAPDTAEQGDLVDVQVKVKNVGNRDVGSFVVTLGDDTDGVSIGQQTINSLAPGAEQTLTFSWDTASVSLGSHTLVASHNFSDDDGGNNSLTDAVTITDPGDPGETQMVMYFSLQYDGSVNGLTVQNEDILAWNGQQFSLFFNGTPYLGGPFGGFTIDGVAVLSETEVLLSFAEDGYVRNDNGASMYVDDCDVVLFTAYSAGQMGANTAGVFSMFFDGSDVGLTTNNEDVDGLAWIVENGVGKLLVSTLSTFSVSGASGGGEDILRFTPTALGQTTTGSWSTFFDGSDVGLTGTNENVDDFGFLDGKLYLTTAGNFSVPGVAGGDEDVFVFTPTSLGTNTAGSYDPVLFFDASGSNDVWGLDLRQVTGGGASLNLTPSGGGESTVLTRAAGAVTKTAPAPLSAAADTTAGAPADLSWASVAAESPPKPRARAARQDAFALYYPADLWLGNG